MGMNNAVESSKQEKGFVQEENKRNKVSIQTFFGNWFGLLMVIICGIFIYYLVSKISIFFHAVSYILILLKPVIYGAVIAYLLNPLMKWYKQMMLKLLRKEKNPSRQLRKVTYGISIGLALISGICIIVVLIWMIVPQLMSSIGSLVNTMPEQADRYYQVLVNRIQNNPYLADRMQDVALDATKMFDDWMNKELYPWLKADLLPNVNAFAFQFANGLINILEVFYNLFVGCIVAVYLLAGKENFLAQGKKIIYGLFGKKQADIVMHYGRITNDMFSGFITGKIVDSTIIGFLCFFLMWIFKLPYPLLISVIIGVTNVIPVFGPYIGAIPCALLILIVSPIQCLYFVILIILLQQLDGNIIGPAILGESTGITAFWVLFSILLFGGMWGIAGMVVGVPLFAVLYRLFKDYVEFRLHKKKLRKDTRSYINLKNIQTNAGESAKYNRFTKEELLSARTRRKAEEKITLTSILLQEQELDLNVKKAVEKTPKIKIKIEQK